METTYIMVPFLLTICFVSLLVFIASIVIIFLKLNRIIVELNFYSQNVLEETNSFDNLSDDVKNFSIELSQYNEKIKEILDKKTGNDSRLDGLKEAFKHQARPQ